MIPDLRAPNALRQTPRFAHLGICFLFAMMKVTPVCAAPSELDETTHADAAPVEEIVRTVLGTATRPVAFAWRKAEVILTGEYAGLVEYNNFESHRLGLVSRWPGEMGTFDASIAHVTTSGTQATHTLARTPYLQTGRPSRWELGLGYSFALAEGVVTWAPSFLPQSQMVFSVAGEMRYLFYTDAWKAQKGGKKFTSLLKTEVNGTGKAALDKTKPEGMRVDPSLLDFLVGPRLDVYVRPGIVVSPTVKIALPLLRAQGGLGLWWLASLEAGYAF